MWIVSFLLGACAPSLLPGTAVDTSVPATETSVPTGSNPTLGPALSFGSGEAPTNLLVVSLDTTRRDRISRYAPDLDTTPTLDSFLEEAVVLDDHRSCSNWTTPSMVCAMTGRHPVDDGFWPASADPSVPSTPDDLSTLARLLSADGFDTRLVTSNAMFSAQTGGGAGFDTEVLLEWSPAEPIRAAAIEQARELMSTANPFYLHVHFFDPHQDYCPPDAYVPNDLPELGLSVCGDWGEALRRYEVEDTAWQDDFLTHVDAYYQAELRYWDDQFGLLLTELDAMGARDDTLVVFLTDHGEQFMERGEVEHALELYAEENRAAAAFWARDLEPRAWTGPTVHQDLAATVMDLYELDGDPTGQALGTASDDRSMRLLHYQLDERGPIRMSVVEGDGQLFYNWDGTRAFHRIDTDPTHRDDLYDATDPQVIELWDEMDVWVDTVRSAWTHLDEPTAPGP